jgi:DNA-binding transcriptional MerR regulator
MTRINSNLMRRLHDKGLSLAEITLFIRDASRTFVDDFRVGLREMNQRLHILGWERIELDYHTSQLIIAHFEAKEYTGE